DAAGRRNGFMWNDFAVGSWMTEQFLFQGSSEDRQTIPVQRAPLEQFLEHRVDAADLVQVLRQILSARLHVGEVGRALRYAREIIQRKFDAGFVRDRGNMQARVGRTTRCRDRGAG